MVKWDYDKLKQIWNFDKLKQTEKNGIYAFIISAIINYFIWYHTFLSIFAFRFFGFLIGTILFTAVAKIRLNVGSAIDNTANRKDSFENVTEKETPLDILKTRFAEGKISEKEFEKKKELLE